MNLHITPTQLQQHQARKEREKRRVQAAKEFQRRQMEAKERVIAEAIAKEQAEKEAVKLRKVRERRRRFEESILRFSTSAGLEAEFRRDYLPFGGLIGTRHKRTMNWIALDVLRLFQGVKLAEIKGKQQTQVLSLPRHLAIYQVKLGTHHSLSEIGRWFNRDHTTILSACRRIEALVASGKLESELEQWHRMFGGKCELDTRVDEWR